MILIDIPEFAETLRIKEADVEHMVATGEIQVRQPKGLLIDFDELGRVGESLKKDPINIKHG